ncbi:MAG: phosphogluconate dehydratase [Halieaceae bacterium]|nr:phosphogluconate dehydratase [Halieaceae bacterium]
MHPVLEQVTAQIRERSKALRQNYLDRLDRDANEAPDRARLSCGNLAHGFAACHESDKQTLKLMDSINVGIVTAYNDMLSAHQPYHGYPEIIKEALRELGSTAQVAGATPAMCDGVTQGQAGMELSLLSRDHIAQSTAVALSHQMFDAALLLGICDKIVPGLLIGALRFGHLPAMFIPAGPMPTGLANKEKLRVRQLYAQGEVGRDALLEAESASYHSAGTCTFYGTANSNQMVLEAMGLQLPGSSFVNPGTELRDALTRYAAQHITKISGKSANYRPLGRVVDERAVVNGIVALLASGGSTNHTIHLIAMARAAGIIISWEDMDKLSRVTPLLAKVYPNGAADINHFHAAGGTGALFTELLSNGLMHGDALTTWGDNFADFRVEPALEHGQIQWSPAPSTSLDDSVIGSVAQPFDPEGGLRQLDGNIGRAVIKISAVAPEHRTVKAPAVVFDSQHALEARFKAGELSKNCVVVVRYQGPKANGMPELHKLTPFLGVLQDKGFAVALVTDGRMSGASGKVPAAIHVSPEAANGGWIGRIQDGDLIEVDATTGTLQVHVDTLEFSQRTQAAAPIEDDNCGRDLFASTRALLSSAETGATFLFDEATALSALHNATE